MSQWKIRCGRSFRNCVHKCAVFRLLKNIIDCLHFLSSTINHHPSSGHKCKIKQRIYFLFTESGGTDPQFNVQLRRALARANELNVPKATVMKALKDIVSCHFVTQNTESYLVLRKLVQDNSIRRSRVFRKGHLFLYIFLQSTVFSLTRSEFPDTTSFF